MASTLKKTGTVKLPRLRTKEELLKVRAQAGRGQGSARGYCKGEQGGAVSAHSGSSLGRRSTRPAARARTL